MLMYRNNIIYILYRIQIYARLRQIQATMWDVINVAAALKPSNSFDYVRDTC